MAPICLRICFCPFGFKGHLSLLDVFSSGLRLIEDDISLDGHFLGGLDPFSGQQKVQTCSGQATQEVRGYLSECPSHRSSFWLICLKHGRFLLYLVVQSNTRAIYLPKKDTYGPSPPFWLLVPCQVVKAVPPGCLPQRHGSVTSDVGLRWFEGGSKLIHQGTAGFSLWFHLPGQPILGTYC